MKLAHIPGNGYQKFLFTELGLPVDGQVSLFLWRDGQSIPHDHSVDELTFVASGTVEEIRKVEGRHVKFHYTQGDLFEVPRGTEHMVRAVGAAVTLNFCMGELAMNALKNFMVNTDAV